MPTVRIATRKSALALWQSNHVKSLLEQQHPGLRAELVPMTTRGDRILDQPLAEIGGKGLFLKELEHALLEQRADLAVHSLKDVPGELPAGLELAAFLPRANPFDALVSRHDYSLVSLPHGATVGTSSLRRQCQLRAARPDLVVQDLRGNVDTRLTKLDGGDYDAIILAVAGLDRLGLTTRTGQQLRAPDWLPAPGQGIIAIESRNDDELACDLVRPLNDFAAASAAWAERALSIALDGSCQMPLAALAQSTNGSLSIQGLLGLADGSRVIRTEVEGLAGEAAQLGRQLADGLLNLGGDEVLSQIHAGSDSVT